MTHFSAKSGSQNTDSRNSPSPIFLKITPRNCPDYTIIKVRTPPFPKPRTSHLRRSPSHTPRHNSSTHATAEPLWETVAAESYPLFRVLRHRTPNSPIYLSEEIHKPLRLIANIPLIQRRKKCPTREEKAPSRSEFPLSMHVVLKTRHVNPNIYVRRFIVHVRSPNLSATRPQLLSLRGATTYTQGEKQPVLVTNRISTGQHE